MACGGCMQPAPHQAQLLLTKEDIDVHQVAEQQQEYLSLASTATSVELQLFLQFCLFLPVKGGMCTRPTLLGTCWACHRSLVHRALHKLTAENILN
jgi:hypothetical protein